MTLSGVSITDPKLGALTCNPAQSATLAPAEALTCTGTYLTTQADIDAGQVVNTASASGLDPGGEPVSATASASVPGQAILLVDDDLGASYQTYYAAAEDIVALNLATGVYSWVFDGSDVGIRRQRRRL